MNFYSCTYDPFEKNVLCSTKQGPTFIDSDPKCGSITYYDVKSLENLELNLKDEFQVIPGNCLSVSCKEFINNQGGHQFDCTFFHCKHGGCKCTFPLDCNTWDCRNETETCSYGCLDAVNKPNGCDCYPFGSSDSCASGYCSPNLRCAHFNSKTTSQK